MKLKTKLKPAGDQPKAIKELINGLENKAKKQTLLGVTGSGKTFTVANVIESFNKPTLVIAHNKTLAAQLAQEYQEFFPDSHVHYFVSYYDYYRPEAYIAVSDTYIEKDAQVNAEIDRLRHATTQSLLTKKDVIVVASVSCIYGLGNPDEYKKEVINISVNDKTSRNTLIRNLITNLYERTTTDLQPGRLRAIGNMLELVPVNGVDIIRINWEGGKISKITKIDSTTREIMGEENDIHLFPAKHYVVDSKVKELAVKNIKKELDTYSKELENRGKILEAERLKHRTKNDLARIKEFGYCSGIENYSRHFDMRKAGEPPFTLLDFFPKGFLTIIDESHITIPQIGGMLAGDRSRKNSLIQYGFRLPSAKDNRPLSFEEFEKKIGPVIYTTATPGNFEKKESKIIVEQIIRPTGLLDPLLEVKGVVEKDNYKGQVKDIIEEIKKEAKKGDRTLVTVLTKKTAEDLAEFLRESKIKAEYIHSEVKTIERIELLTKFRKGEFDCLVGVNLLREGLDLPEVSLVGILDADKEGFLRTTTSLIQTIGRAARNVNGRVILYADNVTGSLKQAIEETNRRRQLQEKFNKKNGITPMTIKKSIKDITDQFKKNTKGTLERLIEIEMKDYEKNPKQFLKKKKDRMEDAVKDLDFNTAALIRDQITFYEQKNN